MVLGIYSYYTDEECVAALQDLINGTMDVSYRTSKNVELDIIKVKSYGNKEISVRGGGRKDNVS